MAGPLPFLVTGDGAVCWRSDVPAAHREAAEPVTLTEPEPARPEATAELARLLSELRQLRAEVERNRLAVQQTHTAGAGQVSAPEDPQQRVEELARRAMREGGLDLGQAYRLVAREHADAWAAAREAATLSEHPGGRLTWD
jgi:hypothetical protein